MDEPVINDLRLQHFRSYDNAAFEFGPGVNIIVGPNASGKTNLLEAVLMIARGSSYRASDGELVQFGASWARLDATMPEGARVTKLQSGPGGRWLKSFEIDGQTFARLSAHRTLPVVVFEPNHILLLHGSPELRRSFMDDLIEQTVPRFGPTRRHYKRVLMQRNALLKRHPKGLHEQLFVWNVRLSELGGQLARSRMELIARFNTRVTTLYAGLSQQTNRITLEYASQFAPELYETSLLKKLESSTELDILRGFTAYGPHRDDLTVLIDGHPASEAASRGETRTLVLALKLLELQLLEETLDTTALLLLDDVFSELDSTRRQALTSYVADHQTFITTTDADAVAQHFTTSKLISLTAV